MERICGNCKLIMLLILREPQDGDVVPQQDGELRPHDGDEAH